MQRGELREDYESFRETIEGLRALGKFKDDWLEQQHISDIVES